MSIKVCKNENNFIRLLYKMGMGMVREVFCCKVASLNLGWKGTIVCPDRIASQCPNITQRYVYFFEFFLVTEIF